jgi:tetratricopeptide (TPR) repeat protein
LVLGTGVFLFPHLLAKRTGFRYNFTNMKFFKVPLRTVVFTLAVLVLLFFGLAWKFRWLETPNQSSSNEKIFLSYVDHGLKDEDRARLEQKISDLENRLATDAEFTKDLSQWLYLGNLKYQLGDLAGAKEIYETKILADHPADAAALENLAQTLYEMEDYEGAELRWRAAISVNPWEVTYLKLVDMIASKLPERQGEIQGILEEAIANLGQSAGLVNRLGDWYADNGQYERALSHYQVVKQLAPENEMIDEKISKMRALMSK